MDLDIRGHYGQWNKYSYQYWGKDKSKKFYKAIFKLVNTKVDWESLKIQDKSNKDLDFQVFVNLSAKYSEVIVLDFVM